jgi:hypothetical protein
MMSMGLRVLGAWLMLIGSACDEEQTPADAGPYDGAPQSCEPAVLGSPVEVVLDQHGSDVTWIEADRELVAVSTSAADGGSYVVSRFDANGVPRGETFTVQAGSPVQSALSLAAEGGVLAIAGLATRDEPGGNQRRNCLLGLVRLEDKTLVRANLRVSDATEDASVLHEAQSCNLTATSTGFVVAWQQFTTRDGDSGLFAQRFALDGALRGERMTLLENLIAKTADLALTRGSDGALIAYSAPYQSETTLAFVDEDSQRTQALAGVDTPIRTFVAAHDGFLLRTSRNLWLLDRDGQVTHGPREMGSSSLVAAIGDGYLTVDDEEYLVARSLDATLARSSEPLGISEDRDAYAIDLLSESDTTLIYGDAESLKLVNLGCGSKPAPLGPKTCPREADLQPLDPGCDDQTCHVVLRFDYLTLGTRGWSVTSAPAQSIDAAQAERAAPRSVRCQQRIPRQSTRRHRATSRFVLRQSRSQRLRWLCARQ